MDVHVEYPKQCTKNATRTNKWIYQGLLGGTRLIVKNQLYFYILVTSNHKLKLITSTIYSSIKNMKVRVIFTKDGKDLCSENCKVLLREIYQVVNREICQAYGSEDSMLSRCQFFSNWSMI